MRVRASEVYAYIHMIHVSTIYICLPFTGTSYIIVIMLLWVSPYTTQQHSLIIFQHTCPFSWTAQIFFEESRAVFHHGIQLNFSWVHTGLILLHVMSSTVLLGVLFWQVDTNWWRILAWELLWHITKFGNFGCVFKGVQAQKWILCCIN